MKIAIQILTAILALFHFYFCWLEMFAWETRGKKVFRSVPKDLFTPMKTLAANLGLYNGFLAAGLVWSLLINDPDWSMNVGLFFLSCVAIAGIYGAYTADRKIFFIQGLPAIITAMLILFQKYL